MAIKEKKFICEVDSRDHLIVRLHNDLVTFNIYEYDTYTRLSEGDFDSNDPDDLEMTLGFKAGSKNIKKLIDFLIKYDAQYNSELAIALNLGEK